MTVTVAVIVPATAALTEAGIAPAGRRGAAGLLRRLAAGTTPLGKTLTVVTVTATATTTATLAVIATVRAARILGM